MPDREHARRFPSRIAGAAYPVPMARTSLELAALATAAVPGFAPTGVTRLGRPGGAVDTALFVDTDGLRLVLRLPRSGEAEQELSAELVALGALSGAIRARLPFSVTEVHGQLAVDETRAVVSTFVDGAPSPLGEMNFELAASVGAAIAAIHSLPTSCVTELGLPSLGPVHARQSAEAVVERASATGLLPTSLRGRWRDALRDDRLWQFSPTVTNGALCANSVLSNGVEVTAVLDWHELRVADPARDLAWLFSGRRNELANAALAAYLHARPGTDRLLAQRATLLAELEIARWLLHGTDTRNQDIVDDAVLLLSGLVDDVADDATNEVGPATEPVLAVGEVEALLDSVERGGMNGRDEGIRKVS